MYRGGESTGTSTHTQFHQKLDDCPVCQIPRILNLCDSATTITIQQLYDRILAEFSSSPSIRYISHYGVMIWTKNFGFSSPPETLLLDHFRGTLPDQTRFSVNFDGNVDRPVVLIFRQEEEEE